MGKYLAGSVRGYLFVEGFFPAQTSPAKLATLIPIGSIDSVQIECGTDINLFNVRRWVRKVPDALLSISIDCGRVAIRRYMHTLSHLLLRSDQYGSLWMGWPTKTEPVNLLEGLKDRSLYQQVRKWCTADQIELCGWVWFSIRRINKSVSVGGYLLSMSVALSAEKFHLTWRVIRETHDVSVCHNESRPTEKWCDCRGKLVTGDWQLTAGWGCCQRHLLPRFGTCDCYRVKRFNLVEKSGLREGACVKWGHHGFQMKK